MRRGASQVAATAAGGTAPASSRKFLILTAMIFAVAMTFIDQTIVSIAVPRIQSELDLTTNGVQWVINAYLLALAATFTFGGRLADMVGHRRMVVIGIAIFALASMACGLTPKGAYAAAWIITFRVVQGIGGAIMYPAALAIVVSAFPVRERGRAMAIFFGVAGGLTSIGPVLGGYLSEWTWRAIFWVNIPVAIVALVLIAISRPVTQNRPGRLDWTGLVLISGGVGLAVFGLQQTQVWGWADATVITCMVAGVLLLAAFGWAELRVRQPLIDVRVFTIRAFAVENIVLFTSMIVFIPIFFFASIYAQVSLGDGVQEAGLYLLIFFAGFAPGIQVGGRVLDKRGAKGVVTLGCAVAAVGLGLWASRVTGLTLNNQWYFIVLAGFGMGLMVGPANTDAINQVGRLSYGEATGITQTVRNFGASFGLAALGTLLVTVERNHLVSGLERIGLAPAAAHSTAMQIAATHGGGSGAPSSAPPALARQIFHAAQLSLAEGTRAVLYAMAAVMVVAAIAAAAGLRKGLHAAPDTQTGPTAQDGATARAAAPGRPARAGGD
jgi:EmrB/QacA subfamily drug resistance transporter